MRGVSFVMKSTIGPTCNPADWIHLLRHWCLCLLQRCHYTQHLPHPTPLLSVYALLDFYVTYSIFASRFHKQVTESYVRYVLPTRISRKNPVTFSLTKLSFSTLGFLHWNASFSYIFLVRWDVFRDVKGIDLSHHGLFLVCCLISRLLVRSSISMLSPFFWSEGRLGSSDVSSLSGISGLSFDSIFLSALLLFCLVLLLILSSPFFLLLAQSPAYFPDISLNFFLLEIGFFCIALVFSFLRLEISWLVVSVAYYLMALEFAMFYAVRHVPFLISWWCFLIVYMFL